MRTYFSVNCENDPAMRAHNVEKMWAVKCNGVNILCIHRWSNMFLNNQNNITDEFTNLIYSNYYTVYWGS